jgi:hypothetical protein
LAVSQAFLFHPGRPSKGYTCLLDLARKEIWTVPSLGKKDLTFIAIPIGEFHVGLASDSRVIPFPKQITSKIS